MNGNLLASHTSAFSRARNGPQPAYHLAADALGALLATRPDLPASVREPLNRRVTEYRATVQRYESDPATGSGKQELAAKAREFEAERDHAQRRDLNFDYARALLQIAIVLGSVSIVAASRPL